MDKMIRILSIDAWASPCYCGDEDCEQNHTDWQWNQWSKVGECPLSLCDKPASEIIDYMISGGYLNQSARAGCEIDDDQYNIVIRSIADGMPLFALEYGAVL
jgi:hypothetical protein